MKLTKKQTNILGVVALVGVLLMSGILYKIRSRQIHFTKQSMEEIGQKFADNEKETIIAWNTHRLHDVWGTEFEIKNISGDGVVVSSAGPDKQFSTKDDIVRSGFKKTPVVYHDATLELIPEKGLWEKVKEKKGLWKFEFKWGKDAKETTKKEDNSRQSAQD